jgi:hypothetical protein
LISSELHRDSDHLFDSKQPVYSDSYPVSSSHQNSDIYDPSAQPIDTNIHNESTVGVSSSEYSDSSIVSDSNRYPTSELNIHSNALPFSILYPSSQHQMSSNISRDSIEFSPSLLMNPSSMVTEK